jgi:transcription antitermination factor NusG
MEKRKLNAWHHKVCKFLGPPRQKRPQTSSWADGKLVEIETFKAGETVQLTHGPFADYVGKIDKIDRSGRVFILMEMMGAKTSVVVKETQIRSV